LVDVPVWLGILSRMPRTMRVEYPGAIYHAMIRLRWGSDAINRGDRREDFPVSTKWIAARVRIGSSKAAKSVLHRWEQGANKPTAAQAIACARLEFASTVFPGLWRGNNHRCHFSRTPPRLSARHKL
jgi:hypothetical protein